MLSIANMSRITVRRENLVIHSNAPDIDAVVRALNLPVPNSDGPSSVAGIAKATIELAFEIQQEVSKMYAGLRMKEQSSGSHGPQTTSESRHCGNLGPAL